MTTLTLSLIIRPDGCLMPDTAPVIAAAVKAAESRRGAVRGNMPRFTLKVDGLSRYYKTVAALTTALESIAGGSACRVFRNAGFGATIDFND